MYGDKVKVKSNLKVGKKYGSQYFVESMDRFKGQICTVKRVTITEVHLKEDPEEWGFTEEMLEPIDMKYKVR